MNQPEGLDVLEGMLNGGTKASSNPLVNEARDVLGQLRAPKSAAWFILLNGIGYALRLGHDTTPASLNVIRQVLMDKDWKVRAAAVYLNLQEIARHPPAEKKSPPRRTRPLTVPPG